MLPFVQPAQSSSDSMRGPRSCPFQRSTGFEPGLRTGKKTVFGSVTSRLLCHRADQPLRCMASSPWRYFDPCDENPLTYFRGIVTVLWAGQCLHRSEYWKGYAMTCINSVCLNLKRPADVPSHCHSSGDKVWANYGNLYERKIFISETSLIRYESSFLGPWGFAIVNSSSYLPRARQCVGHGLAPSRETPGLSPGWVRTSKKTVFGSVTSRLLCHRADQPLRFMASSPWWYFDPCDADPLTIPYLKIPYFREIVTVLWAGQCLHRSEYWKGYAMTCINSVCLKLKRPADVPSHCHS